MILTVHEQEHLPPSVQRIFTHGDPRLLKERGALGPRRDVQQQRPPLNWVRAVKASLRQSDSVRGELVGRYGHEV